jgi:hypothetical protein
MKVMRRTIFPYTKRLAGKGLTAANRFLHENLILEEGDLIRVDAFKAFASHKQYPDVKLTVTPYENGVPSQSGSVYVSLEHLDGLSWEPFVKTETKKKETKPSRRYDVSITRRFDAEFLNIWHKAFDGHFHDDVQIVNPLELSSEERREGFSLVRNFTMGESLVIDQSKRYRMTIVGRVTHLFKPEIVKEGDLSLLGMRKVSSQTMLGLSEPNFPIDDHFIQICELKEDTDIVEEVKRYLRNSLNTPPPPSKKSNENGTR